MYKILVARNARALRDSFVAGLYLDRILEIAQCECQRVKKSVVRFGDPFSDCVVRQVAIVANRNVVVAGMLPRVEMLLHNMAIHARLRIVTQVTGALAVTKCERAQSDKNTDQNGAEN